LSARATATDPEAIARRHKRHNVLALGADLGLFMVGLSFASQSTLLPAFAAYLGAPNVVIGGIPAVMTAGWFLPALFVAGHTEALARKLPFVLRWAVWERVPLLVLGLVAFFLADSVPALAQAVMLFLLFVMTGVGGVLMPAWMDIVGRSIPTTLRGRFFAGANVLGSAGGLLGGLATTYILAALPPPAGYGACFLVGFVFMALSFVALSTVREQPAEMPAAETPSLGSYLGRIPGLLRRDRNLSWFLVARGCAAFGMMAGGFYTVYALRAWQAPAWEVGIFTTVLLVGQTIGNLALGWLADRAGHRLVIVLGVAATVAANALALTAPSVAVFTAVFALSGVQVAALNVSWLSVLLEFAPVVHERPTYVGIGNSSFAPAAFAAPVLAGVMADRVGFPAVFVAAGVFGVLALVVLIARVRDPRHG
jgi:MFS family permease